jgi:predicted DNA-binding transcriptional regulator AlpA
MGTMRRPPVHVGTGNVVNESEAGACPLLLTAKQAAKICGKSLRTWRTWDSAGWIPRPVRIGRSTLWRADELRAWVEAGCPRRTEWEARQ